MKHIEKSLESGFAAAIPLALKYDECGTVVAASTGSLLGRCVEALRCEHDRRDDTKVDPGLYAQLISHASTEPSQLGFSEFAARVTETAQRAGDAVTRELFFVRNTVKPLVDELTARVQDRLQTLDNDPMTGIEIVRRRAPEVLANPSLMQAFSRSSEKVVDLNGRNMRLPSYDDNQIIALIKTGVSELDDAIIAHFSALGDGWLSTAWRNIYTTNSELKSNSLSGLITGRSGVDLALFVFLTARQLWQNPPADVDMVGSDFEEAMVHYRDQAAVALCAEVNAIAEDARMGKLIYSNANGRLEVLEGPYRDFIAKGGDNETLLGFSISGDDYVSVEQILGNQEVYKTAWKRHEAFNKTAYENRRFNAMRDGLLIEYDYMTNTATEEQFPTSMRACARKLFISEVERVRTSDFDNIPMLCMRLICRARFPTGNAEDILEGLQRACDNNPDIGPREAVGIVTIELIARFYAQFLRKIDSSEAVVRM